jgi:hypothetical protein
MPPSDCRLSEKIAAKPHNKKQVASKKKNAKITQGFGVYVKLLSKMFVTEPRAVRCSHPLKEIIETTQTPLISQRVFFFQLC